tara:strand:- start:149 stop:799 length:651 start_codon:yes stop_codon:yes gene_type:complete
VLVFFKPSPNSLKEAPLSFFKNFKSIRVSLFSGLLFLIIFLFVSDFKFLIINETLLKILALNNIWELSKLWPLQGITHLFIHYDLLHVATNVIGIGLASIYERRVGSKRFLIVLVVASLASIPSVIFYPKGVLVCGISGGVFGLFAAFWIDHKNLTFKEWIYAIIGFVFIVILLSFENEIGTISSLDLKYSIDHIGHAMGVIGVIIYCRLKPRCFA